MVYASMEKNFIWSKLSKKHIGSSPLLRFTREITEKELESEDAWVYVHQGYVECQKEEWATKATISILNSIFFHRRKYFILSRESLRKLLSEDVNWKPALGLKNENYAYLLSRLHCGLIEKVEDRKVPSTGRNLSIYEVVDPEILRLLNNNEDTQLEQTRKYIDEFEVSKAKSVKLTKEETIALWGIVRKNNQEELKLAEEMIMEDDIEKRLEGDKIKKKLFNKELKKAKEDRTELDKKIAIIKSMK